MGKKSLYTPRSRVKNALRQLWLRSRERADALKRDKYTCQSCLRKASVAKGKEFKVQVHHLDGIDWEDMVNLVYAHILVSPSKLTVLCKKCHDGIKVYPK